MGQARQQDPWIGLLMVNLQVYSSIRDFWMRSLEMENLLLCPSMSFSHFLAEKRLGTYSKTDFSVDVAMEMPSEIFRSKVPVAVASGKVWAFAFRNWCYWYHRVSQGWRGHDFRRFGMFDLGSGFFSIRTGCINTLGERFTDSCVWALDELNSSCPGVLQGISRNLCMFDKTNSSVKCFLFLHVL